jgi:hypothetical protein
MAGLLLAGLAAGCDSTGDAPQGEASAASPKPVVSETARLSKTMVRAVHSGPGEPPIDLRFELMQRPEVGKPVDISLALIPTVALERVYARFQVSDGLELVKGSHTEQIGRPVADQPIAHTVTVVPRRDGIFTVMAVVLTDSTTESVSRNFTIPLIAGTGLPESAPQSAVAVADGNSPQSPPGR